jgi:hypothetical protein
MPKQLRIETIVTLPDDIVAASEAISDAADRLEHIAETFPKGVLAWSFVTTKPRAGKSDEAAQGSE